MIQDGNDEIPKAVLTEVLVKILSIQKKYAHEFKGVRNDRREEVKDALNKVVTESLEK